MDEAPGIIRPGYLQEDALARAALTLQVTRPVPAVLWRAEVVLRFAGYPGLATRFVALAMQAQRGEATRSGKLWQSTQQLIKEHQARLAAQEGWTP